MKSSRWLGLGSDFFLHMFYLLFVAYKIAQSVQEGLTYAQTGGTLLTKEGMAMGTISYMSPEQACGEEVDHRTDIWSFGVVLYEMFGGQLPFKGEQDQAVVYSILNEQPKPIKDLRSEIPMSIEQIVAKTLEKNPDERYQQVEELLDDLKSISAGIVPEEIKARLRKAKLRRRKRAILYAGITGFIIIMTVIALSLFTGRAEAIDSIAVLPLENLTGGAGHAILLGMLSWGICMITHSGTFGCRKELEVLPKFQFPSVRQKAEL